MTRYRIDPNKIHCRDESCRGAHADSSAHRGLTLRQAAWFSSVMTQRSINRQPPIPARRAARSAAVFAHKRHDILIVNAALAALVLVVVVVLITPFTGAG
jgi:hypothetical protein